MTLQQAIDDAVRGLGYELVEFERSAGGLLRVTIDFPWSAGQDTVAAISVDDCERVTRQLQYLLEVEDVDYRRLEVSSPGIDRPLRHAQDFERFAGELVELVLREPIGEAAAGLVNPSRKRFRGRLLKGEGEGQWQLLWRDAPKAEPGQRRGRQQRKSEPGPEQVLGFVLDELQSAQLSPELDFKGKGRRAPAADGSQAAND